MKKLIEFASIIALLFIIGAGGYSFFNLGIFNDIDAVISVFDGLGWFISLFAIATIFTSYLVVIANTKFIFRFLAIPAWLAFSFALLSALDQFIGYPYPVIPPKSQVLQYRVISNEDQTKTIEAWMYLPSDYRTRLFSFPHSPNREEALNEAMQAGARGELVLIDMKPSDRAIGNDLLTPDEMIIKYNIEHQGLPLKEGDNQNGQIGESREIDRSNKITIQLSDGTVVQIQPGNSFTITDQGEIQMFNDKRIIPNSFKENRRNGSPNGVPEDLSGFDYEYGTR